MLRHILICAALAAITMAVYWKATGYDFVALDDHDNVTLNRLVTSGLTIDGVMEALRTSHPDYWRPLTTLSFMVEYQLHGPRPGRYHMTNIALHAINVMLLFGLLRSMTGALWRSAFVGGLFALHPLHVESVAWITERKDVLSAMFGILSVWTYAGYVRRGGALRYLLAAGFFGLGLMAKPMLVPLPFALLLLDVWPLKRLAPAGIAKQRGTLIGLIVEKVPFLIIATCSCLMTMRAGSRSVVEIPVGLRLTNAVMAYAQYIGKMIWPSRLAVYYPYSGVNGAEPWAAWQIVSAAALLLAMTILALMMIRRAGYLFTGWLWFVGMLAPVIGLLQVGHQSMADRFTYMPLIGLYIIVAWSAVGLASRWRVQWPLGIAAAIALIGCAMATSRQLEVWRNTDALYSHTLAVTENNWKLEFDYGRYLAGHNRFDEAEPHLRRAAQLVPHDAQVQFKYGYTLLKRLDKHGAKSQFEKALKLDPRDSEAHFNLAWILLAREELDEAIRHGQEAVRLDPENGVYRRFLADLRKRRDG